jgi:pimeloyl-ACP methyl ester carboxylesterase
MLRRKRIVTACAALLFAVTGHAQDTSIRPFMVNVPEEAFVDLRRRLAATRWPSRETVADQSQGMQLAKLEELVRHWGTNYDWRKAEARLNAFPQFVTTIDGVDIHFIHVRSRHPNALPVIMTHGWPGSILELLKTVEPLTDPTAHGGRGEDAFDLVIPSIPGFGFSGKPTETGWNPDRIARVWTELMKRLEYTRYVAQGGDWGAPISGAMAHQAPAGLVGIHLNYPASVPPEIDRAIRNGDPAPAGLSGAENAAFEALKNFSTKGAGYRATMGTRPQPWVMAWRGANGDAGGPALHGVVRCHSCAPDDGRGTRLALLECAASVRVIAPAKSGKCYLGNSSAIERMEGVRGEHGSERDVSTMWIEGSKLRTGITATRTSHNREAHARVSDSSVISREGLYESP